TGLFIIVRMIGEEVDSRRYNINLLNKFGIPKKRTKSFINIELGLKIFVNISCGIIFALFMSYILTKTFYFTSIYHFDYFPLLYQNAYSNEDLNDFNDNFELTTGLDYNFQIYWYNLIMIMALISIILIFLYLSLRKIKKTNGVKSYVKKQTRRDIANL
ncbi:MAG: FtsX-like permease family protein, partial [Candidatus Lokiarchaeota archaeon]|nr:FtsX-like permease family protein [Candidatus Lokiarchaeota archaeon]